MPRCAATIGYPVYEVDVDNSTIEVLLRRLDNVASLSDDEKRIVRELPFRTTSHPANTDIVKQGDRPSDCFLVVSGLVCSYKLTGDGSRQIPALYVPGDMPDLHGLHLEFIDTSFRTM